MSYPDLRDLTVVNLDVNEGSNYVSDLTQYGVPDFYEHARRDKDCEDYGWAKRKKLKDEHGWPWQCMRFGICLTEPFEVRDLGSGMLRPATDIERCHGVLLVDHDAGDGVQTWVLDNRKPYPLRYQDCGYTWLYLQLPGQALMEKVK